MFESKKKKKKEKRKEKEKENPYRNKFFWEVKLRRFHTQFKFSGISNSVFVTIEDNFILIVSHLW